MNFSRTLPVPSSSYIIPLYCIVSVSFTIFDQTISSLISASGINISLCMSCSRQSRVISEQIIRPNSVEILGRSRRQEAVYRRMRSDCWDTVISDTFLVPYSECQRADKMKMERDINKYYIHHTSVRTLIWCILEPTSHHITHHTSHHTTSHFCLGRRLLPLNAGIITSLNGRSKFWYFHAK